MSGRQTFRTHCAERPNGCQEVAFFDGLTVADRTRLAKQFAREPWRCTRHRRPEEVLTPANPSRTVVLTAERSQRYPNLTRLFWREEGAADVGSGFMFGPGFKAWADDFPPGTQIVLTATATPTHPAETLPTEEGR